MSEIVIRPAEQRDAGAIWALIQELADYERLSVEVTGVEGDVDRWLFEEPVANAIVAERNGEIEGYSIYFKILSTFKMKPAIWLEDIYVKKESRGQGIGKALISEVIEIARVGGYARVDWAVLDWNETAIGFYESLGARVVPEWRVCRYSF